MTGSQKKEFSRDILNTVIDCILGYSSLEEAEGKLFTKNTLVEVGALDRYIAGEMTDHLKQYIALKNCCTLRKKYDELTEKNLITLLKYLIRKYGQDYFVKSFHDFKNNERNYVIVKSISVI